MLDARQLIREVSEALGGMIELAQRIDIYGNSFPGKFTNHTAVKPTRTAFDKADLLLAGTEPD